MKKISSLLIVDDNPDDIFIARAFLEKAKVSDEIQDCAHGQEALEFLETSTAPQLILLDINMPVMDGFTFIEKFQESRQERSNDIDIVMFTTSMDLDDKERASTYPCVKDFVTKPLNLEKIQEIWQKVYPE